MSTFATDQSFWPPIHSIFDFTLTFEDVVMGIAPATLAILLAPWVALQALRQERCVRTTLLLWIKMVRMTSQCSSQEVYQLTTDPKKIRVLQLESWQLTLRRSFFDATSPILTHMHL